VFTTCNLRFENRFGTWQHHLIIARLIGKIKIFKKKDELMENICHSLDVLLP